MVQLAETRMLADLIAEAQMLSAVLYGQGEQQGYIHEFREVTADFIRIFDSFEQGTDILREALERTDSVHEN